MRFLSSALLACGLVMSAVVAPSTGMAAPELSSLELKDAISNFMSKSSSRLFGERVVSDDFKSFDATTASPSTSPPTTPAAPYGLSSINLIYPPLPYPSHQPHPLPPNEAFTPLQMFGPKSLTLTVTTPFTTSNKRNNFSLPYDATQYTSISQFPKMGVASLTSIDIFGDEYFGLMRLVGADNYEIRRITAISPKFGEPSILRKKYPGIDADIQAGKVFELDYSLLATVTPAPIAASYDGSAPSRPRYLDVPYVLLREISSCQHPNDVALVPIAIQLNVNYNPNTTAVLYRNDYIDESTGNVKAGANIYEWRLAKTSVNAADSIYHQLNQHLAKTHLLMENIIVANHLTLGANHIIRRLLEAHSYKTIQINDDGRLQMFPGPVDELFAGGYGGAALLVDTFYSLYNWVNDYIPTDLTNRGFGALVTGDDDDYPSSNVDGIYFWAQDALANWKVIRSFVKKVLGREYKDDTAVAQDAQLQAWASLLCTPQKGLISAPVPGFPCSVTSKKQLYDILTNALYKSTAAHSSVNYAIVDFNIYLPIYPSLALWRPSLTKQILGQPNNNINEAYLATSLGNVNNMNVAHHIYFTLGTAIAEQGIPDDITLYQYAQALVNSTDASLQKFAQSFADDLSQLSSLIQTRNAGLQAYNKSHLVYKHLDPQLIGNSIYI